MMPIDSKSHKFKLDKKYLDATVQEAEQQTGQLNPDWVEWLMGWPVGWSDLEPITELVWLDWSVDPADGDMDNYPTPQTRDYRHADTKGNLQRKKDRGFTIDLNTKVKELPKTGTIPRITNRKENRINRLKAIGNGQVPQVAAIAWNILNQ